MHETIDEWWKNSCRPMESLWYFLRVERPLCYGVLVSTVNFWSTDHGCKFRSSHIFSLFFSPKWEKKWVLASLSFGECTARVKLKLTDFITWFLHWRWTSRSLIVSVEFLNFHLQDRYQNWLWWERSTIQWEMIIVNF